jgi:hypothetical protein
MRFGVAQRQTISTAFSFPVWQNQPPADTLDTDSRFADELGPASRTFRPGGRPLRYIDAFDSD